MITLAMLTKDPPLDRLAALLEYVCPVIGQTVVVMDTRTDPETFAAVRSLGPDIVPFDWCDDFAAARNAALPLVYGEWVLMLDPDELPTAAMLDYIRSVDASPWGDTEWRGGHYPAPRGYLFWREDFADGIRQPGGEDHWHMRLFRANRGRWYRPVHELVAVDDLPESATRGTPMVVKAPRAAGLIHSKLANPEAANLYARLEEASRCQL